VIDPERSEGLPAGREPGHAPGARFARGEDVPPGFSYLVRDVLAV